MPSLFEAYGLADAPPAAAPPRKPSAGVLRTIADLGVKGAQGTVDLGQSVVGAASLATGGLAGKAMRAVGYDPAAANEILGGLLSPAQQEAEQKVQQADGFIDTLATAVQNPRAITGAVAESVPGMLGIGGLTAAVARRIAMTAAAPFGGLATEAGAKAGQEAIDAAATRLMATAGAAEGAQSAGQIADQAQAAGREYKDYAGPAIASGVATGAITLGAGKLMGDPTTALFTGSKTAGVQGGLSARIAKGAVSEGALQEMPQSAIEQVATNAAMGNADLTAGVGNQAAMGLVTGAAMGMGEGAMSPRHAAAQVRATETVPVTGVLSAAANVGTEAKAQAIENSPPVAPLAPEPPPVDAIMERIKRMERQDRLDAAHAYGVVQREDVAKGVKQFNSKLLDRLLNKQELAEAPKDDTPQLGYDPTAGKPTLFAGEEGVATLDPNQRVPLLTVEDQPTGVLRADEAGTVAPETRADVIDTNQVQQVAAQEAERKAELGLTPDVEAAQATKTEGDWQTFPEHTGSLGIPRAEMPQIRSENHGPLVNFLNARGVAHEVTDVEPRTLKPTQDQYSESKAEAASKFEGERSILVSSDGHVLDGHHQWLAAGAAGEPVKAIRLAAPAKELLPLIREFPSAQMVEEQGQRSSAKPEAEGEPHADKSAPETAAEGLVPATEEAPRKKASAGGAGDQGPRVLTPAKAPSSTAPAGGPAAAKPLSVGIVPGSTLPVAVKDGVVFIGKDPAVDFDSGQPVKVKADATEAEVKQALKQAGALSRRQKFFGGGGPDAKLPEGAAPFSRRSPEANTLRALAKADALFSLPKSDKDTVQGIAEDNDPAIKVRTAKGRLATIYVLTMPGGAEARITVRQPNPYGPSVYGMVDRGDGEMEAISERPGSNPEAVPHDKEDVYVDVSLLKKGGFGSMVYNIAATFAHNTGRILIGDPAGLSNDAMRRRTENMLSSALKFGTTDHLAPHPRQIEGAKDIGVPPMGWTYGDDARNIESLVKTSLESFENAGGNPITFDPATGSFLDSEGSALDRDAIKALAGEGVGRAANAGVDTLRRNAVLRALSRPVGDATAGSDRKGGIADAHSAGRAGAAGPAAQAGAGGATAAARPGADAVPSEKAGAGAERVGLLERLLELASEPAAAGIFYKRSNDEGRDRSAASGQQGVGSDDARPLQLGLEFEGLSAPAAKAGIEALQSIGLKVKLVETQDELPKSGLDRINSEGISGVRGMYDAATDTIYAVRENIDGPHELFFVAMHEAFHRGLRKTFGAEVQPLLNAIFMGNQNVRKEVARYMEQLKIGRNEAIEEVLADMAGAGNARDLKGWDKLVAFLKGVLLKLADKFKVKMEFSDDLVQDLVAGLRRAGADGVHIQSAANSATFSRVVGNTGRAYTAEQMDAMKHVGFATEPVPLKEKAKALWRNAGKTMAQGLVDQFAPVKEISEDAYALLRLAKGASGAFETLLKGGMLKLDGGVYDFDTARRGGVLEKLLIPLQGEHHDFFRWVAAMRAERLMGEGREHLFTAEDISALKTLNQGELKADYTLQHGPGKGSTTRLRSAAYADSLKAYDAFNRNVLDMAEQSGLIDGDARHLWEHEVYVPFYRVEEEGGSGVRGMNIKSGVVRQQAFKELKGGRSALNTDLLENTLLNWAHLIDAGAKNRAAKATLDAMSAVGAAVESKEPTVREMAKDLGKRNGVVWYMEQGEKRFFLVDDPHLMVAISSLEYAGMNNPAMKALSYFKHALTMGVTLSPFFKVRNLVRDSLQVIGTSSIDPNPLKNIAQGWKLTDPKADEYFRLLAGGGTIHFGTMLEGSEAKRVQALVESGVDQSTILDSPLKLKAFYRKYMEPAFTAYNELGNRGEAINRAALYKQLVDQGVSHAHASLQARDLMDFTMQGSFATVRFLTQVVPFFNARAQGLYKLGRAAKEDPARFAAVTGATALASILLLAAYSDDDAWKRREEFDRDNFWWFKFGGTAFRIPKPFEIGAIATLAERSFEWAFDKEMTNKRFRERVLAIAGDNLAMNPIPQLVKPMIDVYSNVDAFRDRPIEPMGMEHLKPEYRFNESTSMTARAISTALNKATQVVGKDALSPLQVDHLMRGYFGWLATFAVQTGDLIARPLTDQPERPQQDYAKIATGGMVAGLRDEPSRYVSALYKQAKEVEQAYGTWRELQKEGKTEDAAAFREANQNEIGKYRQVEAVKRAEAKLNARGKSVERGDDTPEQKREQLREIKERKEALAKRLAPA